jgi:hypothetical protein
MGQLSLAIFDALLSVLAWHVGPCRFLSVESPHRAVRAVQMRPRLIAERAPYDQRRVPGFAGPEPGSMAVAHCHLLLRACIENRLTSIKIDPILLAV